MATRALQRLALCAGSIFAALMLLEEGWRLYHLLYKNIPLGAVSGASFLDPELGWKGSESVINSFPGRPLVLFIGDSFTEGMGVPTGQMYFAEAGRRLKVNVRAYGGRG